MPSFGMTVSEYTSQQIKNSIGQYTPNIVTTTVPNFQSSFDYYTTTMMSWERRLNFVNCTQHKKHMQNNVKKYLVLTGLAKKTKS
jgi:hypothetical protein